MQYDEIVARVQHRAHLASRGEAIEAIHATFQTLAERLLGQEVKDLAAQLPRQIAVLLGGASRAERFGLEEFYRRVSARERVGLPNAIHHAKAVIKTLEEAVSKGEMRDVRAELPKQFDALFEFEEAPPQLLETKADQGRIAARAFEIYVQRGRVPGHELEDWLQAERELQEQPTSYRPM